MEDCSLNTFIYQVTLPQTESPPEFETFVKIIFTCNGVTYESDFFSDAESILEWAQGFLSDFGVWSLDGNELIVTGTLCETASLSVLAGKTIVRGCMIPTAPEYNADANVSDGSCTFPAAPTPNYIDVICDTYTTGTVEYTPGLNFDWYKETCNVNTHRPVVIILHGGGGSRLSGNMISWAQEWASRGYFAIVADYGYENMSTGFTAKLQREGAIYVWYLKRYMMANAALYGINLNNIFVVGTSAGAVLTLESSLASLNINDAYFLAASNSALNLINPAFSSQPSATATVSGAASPTYTPYISVTNKRNFGYHGSIDCKVYYSFAQCGFPGQLENYNAMIAAGVASTLVPYFGEGHGLGAFHDQMMEGGGIYITGVADPGLIVTFAALLVP